MAFKAKPEESKPVTPPEKKTETTPSEDKKVSTITTQEDPQLKATFDFLLEYEGHKYYISKDSVTWPMAKEICEKNGGHLVTITSAQENGAIIETLKSYRPKDHVWIGYTDEKHERKWRWVTGEESAFTYWDKEQPDNYNNVEDYGFIWIASFLQWRTWPNHWGDFPKTSICFFMLEIE